MPDTVMSGPDSPAQKSAPRGGSYWVLWQQATEADSVALMEKNRLLLERYGEFTKLTAVGDSHASQGTETQQG